MDLYDKEKLKELFNYSAAGRMGAAMPGDMAVMVSKKAFNMLKLSPEDILLDLGAGTGKLALKAAGKCKKVIYLDLSDVSLRHVMENARHVGLHNVEFILSPMEDAATNPLIKESGFNKILMNYSLHHLPDDLKEKTIKDLLLLMKRPGKIVMGDIIFFVDPSGDIDVFDEVDYDGGETDFPSRVDFLLNLLKDAGGKVESFEFHPMAGIITADFD